MILIDILLLAGALAALVALLGVFHRLAERGRRIEAEDAAKTDAQPVRNPHRRQPDGE